MRDMKSQEKKLKEIHERAVEMYGKEQVRKVEMYQKFLIINPANLTFCQIGDVLDEFSAAIETGKIAHEIYPGKKEEINIIMEKRKEYIMLVEYLEDAIKFTFRFKGYNDIYTRLNGPVAPKRERVKLLEKQANEQSKMINESVKPQKKENLLINKSIPIVCCETGTVYPSISSAAKDLELSYDAVSGFLKGTATEMSTKGYTFRLYNEDNYRPRHVPVSGKMVKCIETGKIFKSLTAAEEWIRKNTSYSGDCSFIGKAASRPDEICAYGFHWMYCDKKGNQVVD